MQKLTRRFLLPAVTSDEFFNKNRFGDSLLHQMDGTMIVVVINGNKEDIKTLFTKINEAGFNIKLWADKAVLAEIVIEMGFKEVTKKDSLSRSETFFILHNREQ